MFAGGEFYYDERGVAETPAPFPWAPTPDGIRGGAGPQSMLFLNGGAACLTVIGDYLLSRGISRVLLPSYLCPSILDTFERVGVGWEFYQVGADLAIDVDDLAQKAASHQAIYFINYFGFQLPAATLAALANLQQAGRLLIEDNAQAGFAPHSCGDFVFNSLRKFVPYDGGYLCSAQDLSPFVARYRGLPNRRLAVIRRYRRELAAYLLDGQGSHAQLDELFEQSERFYASDGVVEGDPGERQAIERLDWAGIRQVRRAHYEYLLELLAAVPEAVPLFPALQPENMPMGLPVTLAGVSRDWVCQELGRASVGLSIHWDDLLGDPRLNHNPAAVELAGKILTLVIDQRTSYKQIDYQVIQLRRAISMARHEHEK